MSITHLYRSTNQAVSGQTAILWNSEVQDDGGWHSTVTNTGRITPGAGTYDLWIKTRENTTGLWALVGLFVYNSSDVLQRTYRLFGGDTTDATFLIGNAFIPAVTLSAGDYFVFYANSQTSGTIIASDTDTRQTECMVMTSVFS